MSRKATAVILPFSRVRSSRFFTFAGCPPQINLYCSELWVDRSINIGRQFWQVFEPYLMMFKGSQGKKGAAPNFDVPTKKIKLTKSMNILFWWIFQFYLRMFAFLWGIFKLTARKKRRMTLLTWLPVFCPSSIWILATCGQNSVQFNVV